MSSLEALWTLRFDAVGGENFELGGGVLIIETGRLFGGDSGYAYVGSLDDTGSSVSGTVRIIRHDPTITSIFGDFDELTAKFSGHRISDTKIVGQLHAGGGPPASFE